MKKLISTILTMSLFVGGIMFTSTVTAEEPVKESSGNIFSSNMIDSGESVTRVSANSVTSFKDMKGHWAEKAVTNAVKAGYVSGYPDGTFKPNKEVTRAEFTKMLITALKLDSSTGKSSPWYQSAVDSATSAQIYVNDFKDGNWNVNMPRKEMMLLSVRAGITGYKADYDINRNLYEGAKAGLIMGTSPGNIDADGTTTRAQAVVVIERVLSVNSGKILESDKYAVSAAEILWHKTNIFTMMPDFFENSAYNLRLGEKYEFYDHLMQSKSQDGTLSCTVDKLVAVDMDDPKDPNRGLLLDNMVYGANPYYKAKEAKNAYAVVSVSTLTVNGTKQKVIQPCRAYFQNSELLKEYNYLTSANKTDSDKYYFPLYKLDEVNGGIQFTVRLSGNEKPNHKVSTVNAQLVPKKGKISDISYDIIFTEHGDNVKEYWIYSSLYKGKQEWTVTE
ncbi:S-layer homology domain-containing protein [Paenibacillus fonticola]|uniref:S-layer homology domain-containing protein n=1 Tax=Paenibacillus fonticola TaxID=379896 RepID=UPI00036CF413|nr:S-layer homology domain-containing protein [Paenibacillus fonticola]